MKIKFILLSLLFVFVFASCSDDGIGDPVAHGRHQLTEKSELDISQECPVLGGDFVCSDYRPDSDECKVHSDCTAKANGYCYNVGSQNCRCYYHECFEDTDCAADEACVCYAWREHRICAKSCRSSEECGEGHKCVIDGMWGSCVDDRLYGEQGFHCTSDEDECESDYNCPEYYYCVFIKEKGHFHCVEHSHSEADCD